ncbi:Ribonuclease H-like superfamily protein [Abortiporus biennis]
MSTSQSQGMAHLRNLTAGLRRSVSTPSTLGGDTSTITTNSPSSQGPINESPSMAPDTPNTPAEKERLEAVAIEEDHAYVTKELLRYEAENSTFSIEHSCDLLKYWQVNDKNYPYLYRVALDVLPVQASAVSCERVFSSAKETDSLQRNKLSPALLEALQILKYRFRKE